MNNSFPAAGRNIKRKEKLPFEAPIGDRIVVKQNEYEEKTDGGIIIPEASRERPHYGLVVAVGVKESGKSFQVRPGDLILFGTYAGTEFSAKGKEFLIMSEKDALVILERNLPTKW